MAPMEVWEVVGGKKTGGIVVREGPSLASSVLPERLATGALVGAASQLGVRLRYLRISGTGPEQGWVSTRMHGKDVLVLRNDVKNATDAPASADPPHSEGLEAMEVLVERMKELIVVTDIQEPNKPKISRPISLEAAVALQEQLVRVFADEQVQNSMKRAWESADKDNAWQKECARRAVCVEFVGPQIARNGFDSSWPGILKATGAFVRALGSDIYSEDQVKKQILLKWCQHPDYRETLPLKIEEVQDLIEHLRDPASAFAEARAGGLVGRWSFSTGHFEILVLDAELRIVFVVDGTISRGILYEDDVWHRAAMSNGLEVRLRRRSPERLLLSTAFGEGLEWSEESVAQALEAHELVSCRILDLDVVCAVRKAAKGWTVSSKGAPEDLGESVPHPLLHLEACNCGPWGWRQAFLDMCLDITVQHIPRRGTRLVYASLGSGRLWFDWWLLEGLMSRGYRITSAHFIDTLYTDTVVRDSTMEESPLGNITAWLRTFAVRVFAYQELTVFVRQVAKGAHVLAQCDADCPGVDVCPALNPDKSLHFYLEPDGGSQGAWIRENGDVHDLVKGFAPKPAAKMTPLRRLGQRR